MSIVVYNIERIIAEKDLKKKLFAKNAGLTSQMVSDMLAERKIIRADMIPAIASALDVPVSELFKNCEKGA